MGKRTCRVEGCANAHYIAGQCKAHRPRCSFEDCDAAEFARGWCAKHYSRWKRNGDPTVAAKPKPPAVPCSVAGCDLPVRGKGWCHSHYMRWYHQGDVQADRPLRGPYLASVEERFWSKVRRAQDWECWEWTGAAAPSGHGRFNVGDRVDAAYRVAYEWCEGPIPAGLEIDHLCHNPACVNPAHLEPVTPAENKRRKPPKTHCVQGHEYDRETTRFRPDGSRVCIICARWHSRRRHQLITTGPGIPFTDDQLLQRGAYFGFRCWMCRELMECWDHVKPLSRGGWHCLSNLRPACNKCNSMKRSAWPLQRS